MIAMSGFDWLNWRKVANVIEDRRVLQVGKFWKSVVHYIVVANRNNQKRFRTRISHAARKQGKKTWNGLATQIWIDYK